MFLLTLALIFASFGLLGILVLLVIPDNGIGCLNVIFSFTLSLVFYLMAKYPAVIETFGLQIWIK